MAQVSRVSVTVQGRVQGVGYRQFVRRVAERLQLTGWVRNHADGGVEALLEGDESCLIEALQELRRGPTRAKVTHVESQMEIGGRDFAAFVILK